MVITQPSQVTRGASFINQSIYFAIYFRLLLNVHTCDSTALFILLNASYYKK